MKRMIIGVIILISTLVSFFITYSIVSIPLEYNVDVLSDSYTDVCDDMGWDNDGTVGRLMGSLPYFLAGGVAFGIFLLFIWFFVYAHKKEYEQY